MGSMVVFIVEKVTSSLRGELTKWMIEPKSGVFVGKLSPVVRSKLLEKIVKNQNSGGCTMIYPKNNEQGYVVFNSGDTRREIVNIEGLYLVKRKN